MAMEGNLNVSSPVPHDRDLAGGAAPGGVALAASPRATDDTTLSALRSCWGDRVRQPRTRYPHRTSHNEWVIVVDLQLQAATSAEPVRHPRGTSALTHQGPDRVRVRELSR